MFGKTGETAEKYTTSFYSINGGIKNQKPCYLNNLVLFKQQVGHETLNGLPELKPLPSCTITAVCNKGDKVLAITNAIVT